MKKTLITLAALAMASVASAADYTFTVPVKDKFYAGDFSFQFMIHSADDVASTGTVLASYYGVSSNDPDMNRFVLTKDADGAITLTAGRCDDTDNASTWYGNSEIDYVTFSAKLEVGKIYTLSNVGNNQWNDGDVKWNNFSADWSGQAVTLTGGSITTPETLHYRGNMNGSAEKMTTSFNQTFAVPEPATATLSLLALAGLASRRRRK